MWGLELVDIVLHQAVERELLHSARRVDVDKPNWLALEGELDIGGQKVCIRLELSSAFPLELPRFFLQPWDALGFIPHVDKRGFICFADPEGLILDRRQPFRVLEEALDRVVGVLTDGITDNNRSDFVDEFESYWYQLPESETVRSLLNLGHEVQRIIIAYDHKKEFSYVGESEEDISAFYNGSSVGEDLTIENALYLPLKPGTFIIPPRPDGQFWSAEEVRHTLIPALSYSNEKKLRKLIRGRKRIPKSVIVKLPRFSDGDCLFGFRYEGVVDVHPLLEGGTADKLLPLRVERWEQGYIVQRGGGSTSLASKRVLLAGCGAVGGHLAFELARSGILNLTLVDHDRLTVDNTYRHVLGRQYWGQYKAQALKSELEAHLPYIHVKAVRDSIEIAVGLKLVELQQYDLVVFAIGNPTVELSMNERIHSLQNDVPAALFTWLEPLGIGGHALLTNHKPGGGCLECLYTSPNGGGTALVNRAAFAGAGQHFGRALSGCATLHTPYGSMDATRTATLAVQLAVNALVGQENGNPLLSWKGDASAFIAEGFQLSSRYQASDTQLDTDRYQYHSPKCQVCGSRVDS